MSGSLGVESGAPQHGPRWQRAANVARTMFPAQNRFTGTRKAMTGTKPFLILLSLLYLSPLASTSLPAETRVR